MDKTPVRMGTRAAAFSAKIKSLAAAQGVVTAGTVPAPTGADLAASYRWFSATLLSILKASAKLLNSRSLL